MQTTEYDIVTEAELNQKIGYGTKTIYEGVNNSVYVEYLIVGNYKVVSLYYVRNTSISIPTGETELASTELPNAWKPTHRVKVPYAKVNLEIRTDGTIWVYNGTGSSLSATPTALFTYIVRNNTV